MIFYQLCAGGARLRLGGSGKISSHCIFTTVGEAVAFEEAFREIVTTPVDDYDLFVLDGGFPIHIRVVELELMEDES